MISDVDEQLGRLWAALRELEMWDDTFVLVTSDHGEQLGDQGTLGKGGPFEASYRVPGIVRDPRHRAGQGTVVDRSPRTSTSCRRCATRWASRSRPSATGCR